MKTKNQQNVTPFGIERRLLELESEVVRDLRSIRITGIFSHSKISDANIRGFPKVDHLDIDARVVLEQNKFIKKGTSDKT